MANRFGVAGLLLAMAAFGAAQVKKPLPKNQTRGTHQMAGAYVRFGETYSLANGVNFSILKAAYTMDSFPCYQGIQNSPTEKVVVLDLSVKNWRKEDLDFGGANALVTLVDAAGNKYSGESQLKSHGIKETYLTLKPGQGVGQPALNDPYRVGFKVPLDAEITKIIINQPRVGKSEQVLRYVMAGTDKESDPANVIAPLPLEVRDPTNKAGAVARPVGEAKIGSALPAGGFVYTILKVESAGSLSESYTPGEGHKYLIATLKIQNADLRVLPYFDGQPRDSVVRDADGEKYPIVGWLKANSLEEPTQGEMGPGDVRTIRLLFEIPSSAKLESLSLLGSFYGWKLDLKGG